MGCLWFFIGLVVGTAFGHFGSACWTEECETDGEVSPEIEKRFVDLKTKLDSIEKEN